MGGWGGPFGAAPGGGAAAGFACSAGDPVFCAKAAFAATPAATATVEPKKVRSSTDTMVTSSTFEHLASPSPKRGIRLWQVPDNCARRGELVLALKYAYSAPLARAAPQPIRPKTSW